MAEDGKGDSKGGFSLKSIFNKHTMIHVGFMVLGMVVPMAAMAASMAGTTATIGDIALGTVDMGVSMVQQSFSSLPVLGDVASNAFDGDWAAQSYEMGMMNDMYEMHGGGAHDMAGMTGMTHDAGTHGLASTTELTSSFNTWSSGLDIGERTMFEQAAEDLGVPLKEYYQDNFYHQGHNH